jgi:predicted nicotinamide N-methyase
VPIYICCTDYPVVSVIENIQDNVVRFCVGFLYHDIVSVFHPHPSYCRCLGESKPNFSVLGYRWGEDPAALLGTLEQFTSQSRSTQEMSATQTQFDVAIAAECLWQHDSHDILLQSMGLAVKTGGMAILTFSHHVPGLEGEDLKFFEKACASGWKLIGTSETPVKHMWSDKIVPMHIYLLQKL